MLFPKPMGNTAIESFLSNTFCIISFCSDLSCRWHLTSILKSTNVISRYKLNDDSNALYDGSYLMQHAKLFGALFAYANNIQITKIKSDSQKTWKCADQELESQIRCFPYVEPSDVPRLYQK
jgi:hypothetical protein